MAVTSSPARRSFFPVWLDLGRFFANRRRALLWMSFVFVGLVAATVALSLTAAHFLVDVGESRPVGVFVAAVAAAFFVLAVASGWTTLTKLAGALIANRRARVR
jgi:hypothetical protein